MNTNNRTTVVSFKDVVIGPEQIAHDLAQARRGEDQIKVECYQPQVA